MIQIYNGLGAGFDNLYSQLTLRFCTSAVKKLRIVASLREPKLRRCLVA